MNKIWPKTSVCTPFLTTEENNRQLETSILTMGDEKALGGS